MTKSATSVESPGISPVSAVMAVLVAAAASAADAAAAVAVSVGAHAAVVEVGVEVAGAVCDHATLYACHTPSACCPSCFYHSTIYIHLDAHDCCEVPHGRQGSFLCVCVLVFYFFLFW